MLEFFLSLLLAISDYRQSVQFQNLNEEKQNIHLEVRSTTAGKVARPLFNLLFISLLVSVLYDIQVVRGGRRIEISIYDLVVGDVVPLKIGDQVGMC